MPQQRFFDIPSDSFLNFRSFISSLTAFLTIVLRVKAFKKFSTSGLWTSLQFVALCAAMVIPLFSKEQRLSRAPSSNVLETDNPMTSGSFSKPLEKSKARANFSKLLSSGVLVLPDVSESEKVLLFSKSRQIRF